MKRLENRGYVVMFGRLSDCAGKSILDILQAFNLKRIYFMEERIAVVEFGMNY
jgi:hypothetical protein